MDMQRLQVLEILHVDYKITMVILFKQIKRWPWKYLRQVILKRDAVYL